MLKLTLYFFRSFFIVMGLWLLVEIFTHLPLQQAWALLWPALMMGFVIGGTNKATLVVKDTEVGELPKAGSTGIFPYIGVATALMCGAMVMTVVTTKRRKAYA